MNKLTFTSLIDMNKLELKSLFSKAGQYDCPCRRKKMSSSDWKNYKNGYMQKIWKLLHETSFKYLDHPTVEEEKKVFNFFNTDVKRIPCSTCRAHYNEYLKTRDLKEEVKTKIKLVKWLIDLHNNVNKSNNKSSMSYKEVFELYNEDYSEYNKEYKIYTIKSESIKVEPVKVEPVKVEPVKVEPVKVEPLKVEPVKVEPVKVEPVKVEPVKVEPVKVEPVKVEPVKVEPVKVEPVKLEPIKLEPIKLEPIKLEPIKLESIKVEPIESKKNGYVKREDIIGLKPIDTNINVRVSKFNSQLNRIINKNVEPVNVEPVNVEPVNVEPIKRENIIGLKPIDTNINVRVSRFNNQLNKIINKKVDNNSYQNGKSHFSFNLFR
ncbi:ERV1/ALR-related protein [bacterium]|nr:ERV1/ALR-related protein [bacterium]